MRLPLPKLTVAVENPQRLEPFADLIADELNVKDVELTDDIDTYGRFELTVNARVAGPRLGKDVQAAIKAVKAGEGVVNADGTLTAGPAVLLPEEYSSRLVAADPGRRSGAELDPRLFTAALPDGAGPGGAGRHRHRRAGGRGLGQGPHPRTAGAAQVDRASTCPTASRW